MCKYVHKHQNVSLCEEKYAIPSTNMIECMVCEATSECMSSFASVQGIVQNRM